MRTLTRPAASLLVALLVGCSGGGSADPTDSGTPPTSPTGDAVAACEMLAEVDACPECADGTVTCTFEDTSATEISCGGCQAEMALLTALCDAGEPADRATLEAEITCDPPSCRVWYDGCSDPCTPLCVRADEVPDTTCDLACKGTPAEPPGECRWDASTSTCGFEY